MLRLFFYLMQQLVDYILRDTHLTEESVLTLQEWADKVGID